MIKLVNVNKWFYKNKRNEIRVLNDINLTFDKPELVLITGPSGCGKTTLLNTIGLLDTFKGNLTIGQHQFNGYKRKQMDKIRNQEIGYIYQNYSLVGDLTVKANLEIRLNLAGYFNAQENEALIAKALKLVGLSNYENRYVKFLSGGQKQRVGIARAIIFDPQVILADEPTGNLDSQNTLSLMALLKEIGQYKLVILVSHEKEVAKQFCQRIITLSDGKIISDETNAPIKQIYDNPHNVYLGTLPKEEMQTSQMTIDLYSQDSVNTPRFIFYKQNNIIYIKEVTNFNYQIIFNSPHLNLIEGMPTNKSITTATLNASDYNFKSQHNLKPNKDTIKNNVAFWEAVKRVLFNRRFFGKLFIFILFYLGITTLFLVSAIDGSLRKFDKSIKYDNNALVISSKKYSYNNEQLIKNTTALPHFAYFVNNGGVIRNNNYHFFKLEQALPGNLDNSIKLTALVKDYHGHTPKWGQAPTNEHEVCLSSFLVDYLIKQSKKTYAEFFSQKSDFISQYITKTFQYNEGEVTRKFKIVGIIDAKAPTIYFANNKLVSLCYHSILGNGFDSFALEGIDPSNDDFHLLVANINNLAYNYESNMIINYYDQSGNIISKDSITLQDGECLVRKSFYDEFYSKSPALQNNTLLFKTQTNHFTYQIKGYYELSNITGVINKQAAGIIVGSSDYQKLMPWVRYISKWLAHDIFIDQSLIGTLFRRRSLAYDNTGVIFLSNDINADVAAFHANPYFKDFTITKANLLRDSLILKNKFLTQLALMGRLGITFLFMGLVLFFIIRSSTINRGREIVTYRLIGLSTREIKKTFIFEILTYYLIAYLPGSIIASAILLSYRFKNELITYYFNISLGSFLALQLLVFGLFICLGLLPVIRLLRKTPAALQAKYEL